MWIALASKKGLRYAVTLEEHRALFLISLNAPGGILRRLVAVGCRTDAAAPCCSSALCRPRTGSALRMPRAWRGDACSTRCRGRRPSRRKACRPKRGMWVARARRAYLSPFPRHRDDDGFLPLTVLIGWDARLAPRADVLCCAVRWRWRRPLSRDGAAPVANANRPAAQAMSVVGASRCCDSCPNAWGAIAGRSRHPLGRFSRSRSSGHDFAAKQRTDGNLPSGAPIPMPFAGRAAQGIAARAWVLLRDSAADYYRHHPDP